MGLLIIINYYINYYINDNNNYMGLIIIIIMWNLKNGTNELIYKTVTDLQTLKTYGYQRRNMVRGKG